MAHLFGRDGGRIELSTTQAESHRKGGTCLEMGGTVFFAVGQPVYACGG
ncbi:hypothetical protein [Anabaena azotica]|uniref:Uncharacterized protein n=1 Tax=Anabaena azotica FACHB-119 TaxID=947527 RepID=A0ABR8DDE3_9NOST|nr:hypothetical protein [Anabaena azotica]MBD2504942.1 hypothetical protein [Anabaena azotica FACHB-119]